MRLRKPVQGLITFLLYCSSASSKKHLCEVIDKLGEASAKAQRLPAVITTSRKLEYTDQRVYLYTDVDGNR